MSDEELHFETHNSSSNAGNDLNSPSLTPDELEIVNSVHPSSSLLNALSNYKPRYQSYHGDIRIDDSDNNYDSNQSNESENFIQHVNSAGNYEQAIIDFGKPPPENSDEISPVSMFGVTEPENYKINYTGEASLAIENTFPYVEKQLTEEEEDISNIPLDTDLMSEHTMALTVSALLNNIMGETKTNLSSDPSTPQISFIDYQAKQEEKLRRLAAQASSAERLSKPKPKKIPLDEIPQPPTSRKRSRKEQELASERLAKGHPIQAKDIPEPKHEKKINKVKVVRADSAVARPSSLKQDNFLENYKKLTMLDLESPTYEKAPKEFVELISGRKARPQSSNAYLKKKEIESRYTYKEIAEMVDKLIAGHKQKLEDPGTIADMINELTNRRITALNKSDYLQSLKLQKLADEIKTQFRLRDREQFHQEYIADLNSRLKDSKLALKKAEQEWAKKEKSLQQAQKEQMEKLEERMDNDMADLEYKWQAPETTRRFSKKSPQLLNQAVMERNMALIGDLEGAAKMQKVVRKNEQIEAEEKYSDMQTSFEKERKNLIEQQDRDLEHLKTAQYLEYTTFIRQKDEVIDAIKKRISTYERIIGEDSDIDRFCARKFKRTSDVVIPINEDIPTQGKARATPVNLGGIMSFREAPVASPLQLPTLKIKKSARKNKTSKLANL